MGNIINTTDTSGKNISSINPYRYRGYRYDNETEWYYLNSRYYNPEIGRFINADDPSILSATQGEILSHNLYAYCGNNPVMREDENGYFWHILVGATVGALFGVGAEVIVHFIEGNLDELDWKTIGNAALTGALSGALAATGVGLLGQVVGNAAISGGREWLNGGSFGDIMLAAGIGAAGGMLGGPGAGKNFTYHSKQLNKKIIQGIRTRNSKIVVNGAKLFVKNTRTNFNKILTSAIRRSFVPYVGYNAVEEYFQAVLN